MRRWIAALPLVTLISACTVTLPNLEQRISRGPVVGAPADNLGTPASLPAAGQAPTAPVAAPAQNVAAPAKTEAVAPPAAAPAQKAPAVLTEAIPADAAPDEAAAFLELREYAKAYESRDPAKVAGFEQIMMAAKRDASKSAGDFRVSLEQGHAEIFNKGKNLQIVTASFAQIQLDKDGDQIAIHTRDGSPLVSASFEFAGLPGKRDIARLVFKRDAEGKLRLAELPAEFASLPIPLGALPGLKLPEGGLPAPMPDPNGPVTDMADNPPPLPPGSACAAGGTATNGLCPPTTTPAAATP